MNFINILVLLIKFIIDFVGIAFEYLNIFLYPFDLEYVYSKVPKKHLELVKKDKFFIKNLSILCKDLRESNKISLTGRILFHMQIQEYFLVKYRFDEFVRENPEVSNIEIKKPVFIVTLPRTGSTFMHVTMQQDKRWFCPEVWMQNEIVPPPSKPYSEKDLASIKTWNTRLNFGKIFWSKIDEVHHMVSTSPEDMMINNAINGIFFFFAMTMDGVKDYKEFILNVDKSDWVKAYKTFKLMMQCTMYNYPDERLLTMTHMPSTHVEALLEVFPDAQIITIHRDPVKALASITSLLGIMSSQFYTYGSRDLRPLGDKLCDMFYRQTVAHFEQKERIEENLKSENTFIDINFRDLVKKPLDTYKNLYEKLGMEWTTECENTLTNYMNNQKEHKKGKHVYSEDVINRKLYYEKFSSYIKKYSIDIGL